MPAPYFVIDAFSAEPFAGNPAAVVRPAAELSDAAMLRIASEFNLSETTFVLRAGALGQTQANGHKDPRPRYCFRWFTPRAEVSMCGHATVAGIRALWEWGTLCDEPADQAGQVELAIETRSGVLTAWAEPIPIAVGSAMSASATTSAERRDRAAEPPLMIWLALPEPKLRDFAAPREELAEALGLDGSSVSPEWPLYRTQDDDLIIWVDSAPSLFSVRPDFRKLAQWCEKRGVRGVCVATTGTLDEGIDVQSRFFAPLLGVDEDPVTGSVHGPLACALARRGYGTRSGDTVALSCVQGIPGGRFGQLYALVDSDHDERADSVRIGGLTQVVMRGDLLAGA